MEWLTFSSSKFDVFTSLILQKAEAERVGEQGIE